MYIQVLKLWILSQHKQLYVLVSLSAEANGDTDY